MDEQAVREHAQATCDALLAGDIGKAAEERTQTARRRRGVTDGDPRLGCDGDARSFGRSAQREAADQMEQVLIGGAK